MRQEGELGGLAALSTNSSNNFYFLAQREAHVSITLILAPNRQSSAHAEPEM